MQKSRKEIAALLKAKQQGIQLELGGGENPNEGFVNIDVRGLPQVDICHNLEEIPWPLPDECASVVLASHLIEHINPVTFGFLRFMNEVWRVTRKKGKFMIAMPYGTGPGYAQDPTHVNPCNEATWAYFDPFTGGGVLYKIYKPRPWKIINVNWDVVGNMQVVLEKRNLNLSTQAKHDKEKTH